MYIVYGIRYTVYVRTFSRSSSLNKNFVITKCSDQPICSIERFSELRFLLQNNYFLISSTSNVLTAMGLLMFLIKEQPIKPTIFAYYHYALEFRSRPTKHDTFYQWSIDPRTRISRSKLFDLVRTINKKNRKISDQAFPRSLRFTFAE